MSSRIYAELRGDRVIWMIFALLALFSIIISYSATGTLAFRNRNGDTTFFLLKQVGILGLGFVLAYICYLLHPKRYSKMAATLLLISIPLLAYTLILGANINDARRWVEVPFTGLTFQTSDFAEIALIIYLAKALSISEYIKDFNSAFLPIIVPVIIICGLILPADLSTAGLIFTTAMLMMFIGRVDLKYIVLLIMCGIVLFAAMFILGQFFDVVRSDTWVKRVQEFMNNEDGGYQIQHSKMAIAAGGLVGIGPGNSIARNYLPSAQSDCVFAIICEEYGLIGGFMVLSLYLLLLFRVARLVTVSSKGFGAMLALGLTLSIVIQAMANVAVTVHLVPVTGLTLPMVSYGGTSLIFTCISFGIILSVSKNIQKITEPEPVDEGFEQQGGGGGKRR
ncbi:MAG: FtsW/RodA/SpoVE family cell cycle protein [Saprospiraceae bacterium]